MGSDVIVAVEHLSKKYELRHRRSERYSTLRDVLARGLASPARWLSRRGVAEVTGQDAAGRPAPGSALVEDFWALKDVSFEVNEGDVLGIIGRNGAGKSTLLKILSRITDPTEGRIRIRGRVSSLLEVGTGFHPELTGRENIFLNGAILGMSGADIRRKFDEIVAFAEVERFLDTPVKRYSSGMYVRLAFGVAAYLEPDVLIIDEVLAVGDAEFQRKCLGKMRDVAKGGRTVLFVSHNMAAVQALCKKGIVLEGGRAVFIGDAPRAVSRYLDAEPAWAAGQGHRPLSTSITLRRLEAAPVVVPQFSQVTLRLDLEMRTDEIITDIALLIHAANGERIALIDLRSPVGPYRLQAGQVITLVCDVTELPLVEAEINVGLYVNADSVCQSFMNLLAVTVVPSESGRGVVPRDPQFRGSIELRHGVRHTVSEGQDEVAVAAGRDSGT